MKRKFKKQCIRKALCIYSIPVFIVILFFSHFHGCLTASVMSSFLSFCVSCLIASLTLGELSGSR